MSTFAITGPITLDARLVHGTVTVHMRDDLTEATFALTPHRGSEHFAERITVAMRGDTLTVRAPRALASRRELRGGTVDAEFTVPTGTALKLATQTADITVAGHIGPADVVTGTGALQLDAVNGSLRLRCDSSNIEVSAVTGSAHVRSGSGEISFGNIGGALDAASGSGRLEVGVIRGALRSKCGSGTTVLNAVYGDVDLLSESGPDDHRASGGDHRPTRHHQRIRNCQFRLTPRRPAVGRWTRHHGAGPHRLRRPHPHPRRLTSKARSSLGWPRSGQS